MKRLILPILAAAFLWSGPAYAQRGECAAGARSLLASLPGKKKEIIRVVARNDSCLVVVRVSRAGQPARIIRRTIKR